MIFKLTVIFILIFYFFIYFLKIKIKKKAFNVSKLRTFNKKNLNNWMNLTKKERYDLLKQESLTYQDKRKLLLDEIRKEYKKVSKLNSEKK